ncbi:MAG: SDR family oxidoreductase [Actinobacteria bacterium]|nr:MAG: SDR family oxidoreductase [Actinomycetota bacterium]
MHGKNALVTGGASGIGAETARLLAANGASVTIVDLQRASGAGEQLATAIGGTFVAADVGDPAEWARIVATFDHLEFVHLNAGVVAGTDLFEISLDDYRRMFRVNVDGVAFGVRAVVPKMHSGSIVATASLAGIGPFADDPVYAATKHAVVGLVRSLAEPLRAKGITINCVCPGMTATGLLTADARSHIAATGLRIMQPVQVAEAVMACFAGEHTGGAWVVELGRELMPYNFRGVPGPR